MLNLDKTKQYLLSNWNYILLILVGFVTGFVCCFWFFPRTITDTVTVNKEVPVIQEKVVYQKDTVIQYLHKNTGENTDVELQTAKPNVEVKVNGKSYQFEQLDDEQQKFEKGKVVLNEHTQLRLDITAKQPNFSMGFGYSNHGIAVLIDKKLHQNMSTWVYGDSKTVAGGIKFNF